MKMVQIRPVKEPKSFADVPFTKEQWQAANRDTMKTVPFVTAMEAIKNSKGAYELVPAARQEVELKVEGLSLDQMDGAKLRMLALHMGVTTRKKQIKISELREMVRKKMEDIEVIDDDTEVEGDDEPDEPSE